MKNYNEQDVLNSILGAYKPGFLQIYLTHPFNGGLANFTQKERGTFFHEYVHFLQNISTPWGLYTSMAQYESMAQTYAFIQETSDEINLPLRIRQDDNLSRKMRIINLGNGYNPLSTRFPLPCRRIDCNKDIAIHKTKVQIGSNQYYKNTLEISFQDGFRQGIELGAAIIKESMAAMCQQMVDPTATHPDDDLPYNLVQILSDKHFPNIAGDRRKLISICYISLFSLSPSEVLLNMLDYANQNPCIPGLTLFSDFLINSKITTNKGNEESVDSFMDWLIDSFKEILKKLLNLKELDYIEFVLEQVRISKQRIPLLFVIHQTTITPAVIEGLVGVLGIPFTYNHDGQIFFPKSQKDPQKDPEDMKRLIQNCALFEHLTRPNCYRCCPLKPLCLKADKPIAKEECIEFPWEGVSCSITPLTDFIGMRNKQFRWN